MSKKPSAKPKKVWKEPVKTLAKRAAAAERNAATRVRQPRQSALIEDARIPQLDAIGAAYADIRDQRIALNQEEASLKQTAIGLMHKYGKTIYRHETIEIVITAGDESIKVKVKNAKAPDTDTTDSGDVADAPSTDDSSSDDEGDEA